MATSAKRLDRVMADSARLTDDDWKHLFGAWPVLVGTRMVQIRPFSLEEFSECMGVWELLSAEFRNKGIALGNIDKHLMAVAAILVRVAPSVLAMATGLVEEDIRRLPLGKVMELASVVVSANSDSLAALEKNFLALAGKATGLMKRAASAGSANSSSEGATAGATSEGTRSPKSESSSGSQPDRTETSGKSG